MSRTEGSLYQDTPHGGAYVIFGNNELSLVQSNIALAENQSAGQWYLGATATGTVGLEARTPSIGMRRLIEAQNLQEQFGGAQGPIPFPGFPPFISGAQPVQAPWLTPPTNWPPKGVEITDIFAIYGAQTHALTSAALTLYEVIYANLAAPTIKTPALNSVTLPLATTTLGSPNVVVVPVTTPAFTVDDLAELFVELDIVAPSGTAIQIYGIGCHFNFNYN